MLNRPQHDWQPASSGARSDRGFDAAPALRLWTLFGICLLPLLVIAARLMQLQSPLQAAYMAPFEQVREVLEELPAREGRILAADGSVLADDFTQYDLHVHYRWLEEPADPRWLRRKAWERLSRAERRQAAVVSATEQQILRQRHRVQSDIAELSGRPLSDLHDRAREIQIQVERVWEVVDARLAARRQPTLDEPSGTASDLPMWQQWWDRVTQELTQPPDRSSDEPLVIHEQETYHLLWTDVPETVAAAVAAHPERFPGVKTQVRSRRVYPHRDLASHLLGARTPLRREEVVDANSEAVGEPRGRTALEKQYNQVLHGRPGQQRQRINRHGEVLETVVVEPPRHGRDLVLTLDLSLQQRAEQLLDRALLGESQEGDDASPTSLSQAATAPPGGCLVAIDVRTGAVLAAAAAPRFDANLLISADQAAWNRLAADPRKPFFPRLTHMALPPGSVFKAVTAAALLQSEAMHPDDTIVCRGYLDRPEQHRCLIYRHHGVGHYETDLARALSQSCNVYFFAGARKSGPQPLITWSERFGIGVPTGIDLPTEATGHLPRPDTARSETAATTGRRWHSGDTLGLAIGQSSLTTTPLQVVRMMAAIANGGFLVTPHLATSGGPTRIEPSDPWNVQPVFAHPEPQPIPELSPATLAAIQEGLYRVVHDPSGTGFKTVRLTEVTIAGKTGTAEAGGGRPDHAWFAGFTPVEEPRVAFVVVIEHGGSGSKTAGPIAREFVKSLLDVGLISASDSLAGR